MKVFSLLSLLSLCLFATNLFAAENRLVPLKQEPASHLQPLPPDIHDIYPVIPLQEPVNWLLLALIVLGIIIVIALIVFFLLKRRKVQQIPTIPAHETALMELLAARRHIEANNSILYGNRASEILRNYIENRFSIHSTRQTTSEFLDTIKSLTASPSVLTDHQHQLAECLQHCDLAKYAHRTSTQESLEDLEKHIRHFIENTTNEEVA